MDPSSLRSHLLNCLQCAERTGSAASHWEFSRQDELRLFEFIHPSVNTRDAAFRLFNLDVKWDKPDSALVDRFGKRMAVRLDHASSSQGRSESAKPQESMMDRYRAGKMGMEECHKNGLICG